MKRLIFNMRLRNKIFLAPLVVFIFMILLAAGTYMAISIQTNSIDDMYNNRFKAYEQSSHIMVEMSLVQAKLYKIMTWIGSNYDAKRIDELAQETISQIAAAIQFTKTVLDSPNLTADERKLYEIAYENLVEFQDRANNTLEIASTDASVAAITFVMAEQKFADVEKSLQSINELENKLGKDKYEQAKILASTTLKVFLLVVLLAVVISVLTTLAVTNLILQPIGLTIKELQRLAGGDLTHDIELQSRDEIGKLVQSVNEMRGKMNDVVGQALRVSGALKDSAAEEAAAIEETSASLDEIASMTSQNTENTVAADKLMQQTKAALENANQSMSKLTSSMQEITQASEQTQKIVKSIDEIEIGRAHV